MLVEHGIVDEQCDAKLGIYALGHAAAFLFIEQGWSPKTIQTILRHASNIMIMDFKGHPFEITGEDTSLLENLESDLLAA